MKHPYFLFFYIGFLHGLIFGLLQFTDNRITFLSNINSINFLKDNIFSITPNSNFLSDIAAFEGGLIAIAIPLSFEMVSRISERYKSKVITNQFFKEWEVKYLPIFLIFNIITAIFLRFFDLQTYNVVLWSFFSWPLLAFFLIIAILFLFCFLPKLKKYLTDVDFILNKLYSEAGDIIE